MLNAEEKSSKARTDVAFVKSKEQNNDNFQKSCFYAGNSEGDSINVLYFE